MIGLMTVCITFAIIQAIGVIAITKVSSENRYYRKAIDGLYKANSVLKNDYEILKDKFDNRLETITRTFQNGGRIYLLEKDVEEIEKLVKSRSSDSSSKKK